MVKRHHKRPESQSLLGKKGQTQYVKGPFSLSSSYSGGGGDGIGISMSWSRWFVFSVIVVAIVASAAASIYISMVDLLNTKDEVASIKQDMASNALYLSNITSTINSLTSTCLHPNAVFFDSILAFRVA